MSKKGSNPPPPELSCKPKPPPCPPPLKESKLQNIDIEQLKEEIKNDILDNLTIGLEKYGSYGDPDYLTVTLRYKEQE